MGKQTKIKFKRKGSTNNNNVSLSQGEPYYNIADKHLYIGNKDDDKLTGRKHLTEVTVSDDGKTIQIGEDPHNKFSIEISTGTDADGKTYIQIGEDDKNKIALDIATKLQWQEFGDN